MAYDEGYAAGVRGDGAGACKYDTGTDEHREWMRGHRAGEAARDAAR